MAARDLDKKVKVTKTWYDLGNTLYKYIPIYENIPIHNIDSKPRTRKLCNTRSWPSKEGQGHQTLYVLDNVLYTHIPRYENLPPNIVDYSADNTNYKMAARDLDNKVKVTKTWYLKTVL